MESYKTNPGPTSGKTESLAGWSAVEDYLQRHDSGMVKDYADDIDTLLVFAGLFSAVLTAFVVESYTLLQPDSTQTTNQLLTEISAQLRGAQPTTADSLIPAFVPSVSARWINTLFFLSLVFSLAAALFGILSKQWLREYMRWNSPLATPRENVLVRQIRYEAWEVWNIAATISSIPALLEVAMLLFLTGIVVLLWTLDSAVAIVITVASALFLGAVSAFTILPIFFKRCPYKSPTAWASIAAATTLTYFGLWLLRLFKELPRYLRSPLSSDWRTWMGTEWPRNPQNWRDRERHITVADMFQRKTDLSDVYSAVDEAIHVQKTGLRANGTLVEERRRGFSRVQSSLAALQDLHEVSILFRSLSWVYKASDDVRTRGHVTEAMNTIHTKLADTLEARVIMNTSDWCLIWALQTGNVHCPAHALLPSDNAPAGIATIQRKVREMWERQGVHTPEGSRIVERIIQRVQFGGIFLDLADADSAPLLAYLVDADLLAALRSLQRVIEDSRNMVIPVTMGRFVLELLCVLGCIYANRHIHVSDLHLRGVQAIIGSKELKTTIDTHFPGLRSSALLVASRLTQVESHNGVFNVIPGGRRMGPLSYALLITAYFNRDIEDYNGEDRHIFVLLANEWTLRLNYRTEHPESVKLVKDIVNRMADVAEYSLRTRTPSCGCYFDVPWLLSLWSTRGQHFPSEVPLLAGGHHAYLRFMHTMMRLHTEGLLPGYDSQWLCKLLAAVHDAYPTLCQDEECLPGGSSHRVELRG